MSATDAMSDLLLEAVETVKKRGDQYGTPIDDFQRIAQMWNVLNPGRMYQPHEVAMYMICLKLSRMTHSHNHRDNWLDICGYAACGYACVQEEEAFKDAMETFAGEDSFVTSISTKSDHYHTINADAEGVNL